MKTREYLENILKLDFSEKQKKYYNFLLEKSVLFSEQEELETVKKFSRFNNPQIKQCYKNSIILAFTTEIDYVEGYYVFNDIGFPIEHAWNIDSNKVIDTTAILLNSKADEYYGVIIPKDVLAAYLDTEQFLTPLQFYFTDYVNL